MKDAEADKAAKQASSSNFVYQKRDKVVDQNKSGSDESDETAQRPQNQKKKKKTKQEKKTAAAVQSTFEKAMVLKKQVD